jgi:uncharacterized protein with NRDE domain
VCTIAVWHRVHPEIPLVVAANRDEFYARSFRPPEVIAPGIVAGVDELAGGTWMGATASGFFAGLTNVRPPAGSDRSKRSRGELVLDVLRAGTTAAATATLAARDPADYNPFYLLFGDAAGLRVAAAPHGAASVAIDDVPSGMHVLPNGPLDAPSVPKVARVAALVPDATLAAPDLVAALHRMLGDHELARATPLASICVHTPVYGTGSATVLLFGQGRTLEYHFAAGPPCTTRLDDVTALLR